jgi:hypothetical protein
MSWGAQNRSKDAKTPSAGRVMSEKSKKGNVLLIKTNNFHRVTFS